MIARTAGSAIKMVGASTWIEPGQVTVTPVPEPSLTVLVAVGGFCLAGWTVSWRQG